MVPRCGYFAKDGVLVRRTVWINWNIGFDKEAKHRYAYALIEALEEDGPVAEVTSGSPIYETRSLSPLFVKMKSNPHMSVEEYLQMRKEMHKSLFSVQGVTDLVYLQNIGKKEIDTLHKYNCYCDIFANPNKGFGNSQACSLAIYRVLEQLNKLYIISDDQEFMHWYRNEMEIQLIS